MKNYVAIFWRGNPQLANGGYYTASPATGKSIETVTRRLQNPKTAYGTMSLINVMPAEEYQGPELGTYGTKLSQEEYDNL